MSKEKINYSISISFERITIPPFKDILVLTKKCPQGMIGVSKCMQLISPENYEVLNVDSNIVEALIVGKHILSRINSKKLIELLSEKVFPFIVDGETIKVDFDIKVLLERFEVTLENTL